MLGLNCDTATSPIETVASRSDWGSKLTPLLVVLSSPPDEVATHHVVGSGSYTAMSTMRPLMLAGPIDRQLRPATKLEGSSKADGSASVFAGRPGGCAPSAKETTGARSAS